MVGHVELLTSDLPDYVTRSVSARAREARHDLGTVAGPGPTQLIRAGDSGDRPFQGLGFYTEKDAKWFFGRTTERKIILAHLRTAPLTLLYAESGVGKSSLLRAGVAARLRELASAWTQAASPDSSQSYSAHGRTSR